ncbi:MAG: hypothetical protein R3D32_03400 [Nitratireductor sp.]
MGANGETLKFRQIVLQRHEPDAGIGTRAQKFATRNSGSQYNRGNGWNLRAIAIFGDDEPALLRIGSPSGPKTLDNYMHATIGTAEPVKPVADRQHWPRQSCKRQGNSDANQPGKRPQAKMQDTQFKTGGKPVSSPYRARATGRDREFRNWPSSADQALDRPAGSGPCQPKTLPCDPG